MFAHWRVPASLLRPMVHERLTVQEFDGSSWVGVVPFRMEGVMVRPLPDLPWISAFPELNLRLYVEHDGKAGVWFLSLDATNILAVAAARAAFRLPYFLADMRVDAHGESVRYCSVRRSDGPRVAFRGEYRPTSRVFEPRPGTLEHFLTERYCLYTRSARGRLLCAEVHHHPWSLQTAEAEIAENTVAAAQGVAVQGEPLLHFSRRQDVVVWPPYRVTD